MDAPRPIAHADRTVPFLGRVLIAPLFFVSAAMKIAAPGKATAMIAGAGLPAAAVGVWIAAAIEIGLPVLLILGYRTRAVAWTLAGYCVATAVLFHLDWSASGQMMNFLKNIAIAGGLIALEAGAAPAAADSPI